MRMVWPLVLLLSILVGGCGGYYVLTAPDQVGPAGGEAVAVARLQRNDFFFLDLAAEDAAIQFRVGDMPERAAYTDSLGYAGATVPVPKEAGRYEVIITHMDYEGEEVTVKPPVYVWAPDKAIVAVDLDCLPTTGLSMMQASRAAWSRMTRGMVAPPPSNQAAVEGARTALARIARDAGLLYLTRQDVRHHAELHKWLAAQGYPDGPILLWQREQWHIVRKGQFKMPQVVIESRLVSQLAELRKVFPNLAVGVCGESLAAKSFAQAGMRSAVIGPEPVGSTNAKRFASWRELAEKGL